MGFPVGDAVVAAGDVAELLEFAASDDVSSFRLAADSCPSAVCAVGLWYGRCMRSGRMLLLHRTALMVAASFGSLDVLHHVLTLSTAADVNLHCDPDGATALHCAVSGGSPNAAIAATLLLDAGANPNAVNAAGLRPFDVIFISPGHLSLRSSFESLLLGTGTLPLSPSSSDSSSSYSSTAEKKEKKCYPIDPSYPDIKSSLYSSDEFRMYAFKIQPCSRAYSHDWTECPFVHPGENARRRNPRKFQYSSTPCPEFRRGLCPKGDICEYAHGVFECWLHPAQYRTRLCKEGEACSRRVCFFAHSPNELRQLQNSQPVVFPHIPVGNPQACRLNIPCRREVDVGLPSPVGIQNGSLEEKLTFPAVLSYPPRYHADYFSDALSPVNRNQQQQKQSLLSHKVGNSWSPRNANASSPFAMSPRNVQGVAMVSPLSYCHGSLAAQREKLDQQMRNYPSTSMGTHVKQDCIENYEFACIDAAEGPDLSWVQSLVGKPEVSPCVNYGDGKSPSSTFHEEDEILGALLKQMHLNHREAW